MVARLTLFSIGLASALAITPAHAFTHIVVPGETLADIAQRMYGDPKKETVLASANSLDAQGGSIIRPGMRLEVPAPAHHRCNGGESWAELGAGFLGDAKRGDVLARYNDASAWVPVSPGQEIAIPYVLSHIAADGDLLSVLAKRYLKDANRSWELDLYNDLKGSSLHRGDMVLVPLLELGLTEEGRVAARRGEEFEKSEGKGAQLEAQRRAEGEIPALLSHVRGGRYVDAVALGNRLLGSGDLTSPQLSRIHRALLEAYVALDATGAAEGSCAAWRARDPAASLEPARMSPKIRAACARTLP